ncbi:hypothetical protein ACFOZ0_06490 [Streptomyces yaanensis]|uniref:Apea-like HEPN domain-containing protein n=1 Tax=Streptomyces yaanensis TaxID=1142239 RepID=A0ABV7S798_9ACTN|nr:hypothetical protein [Streptomyces sp. CGMCC 4.7035]WNC02449.1 hypothetical protein Q2K21_32750 [Streptomyces sp. CGMCC 4.7035]
MSELAFEDSINALKLVLGIDAWTDSQIILENPVHIDAQNQVDRLDVAELKAATKNLNEGNRENAAHLKWDTRCEYLIVRNGALGPAGILPRDFDEIISSEENGLKYSIGNPSLEFGVNLLHSALDAGNARRVPFFIQNTRRRLRERRLMGYLDPSSPAPEVSLEKILGEALPVTTLRIESTRTRADFKDAAEAFLFQLAFNYDVSYRVAANTDHLSGAGRVRRRGRAAEAAMDAPRMTYNSDLVHHYQLAVSAESPMLQYLSYYHIAEHFFEKVFNDDFEEQVRRKIADPAFSLKRSKDIKAVIKLVTATQRRVRDEGGVDEQRALALVLEGYVTISRLIDDLTAHDPDLIEYYKSNSPSFSENVPVNLEADRDLEVKAALAKRIYQTRNSLVHAKDGARPKYFPFVDDAELSKEVPLLRFCAEQVIIAHGKVM